MLRILFAFLFLAFPMLPPASASPGQQEAAPTVNVLQDSGNPKEQIKVEMTPREKLLARLRDEHRNGNYLDISEADIASLTDEQIGAIYATEELIVNAEAVEKLPGKTEGGEDIEVASVSEVSEENVEKGFFDSAIEKVKENKAAAAAGAAAAGGIGYMLYGRMLANAETAEEKEARRRRMMRAMLNVSDITGLIGNESVSDRDIIITEAEKAVCSPPASQVNRLMQQLNRTAAARSELFAEAAETLGNDPARKVSQRDKERLLDSLAQAGQTRVPTYTAAQIEEARANLERKNNGKLKDVLEKRAEVRDPSILSKETPKPAAETKKQSEDQKPPENKQHGVGRVNI